MAAEAGMVMIRLGAGIDSSIERSFVSVEQRSLRAGRAVARNLGRGVGGASGAPDRAQAASLRRQEAEVAKSARRRGSIEVTEAERAINAIDRARRRGTDRAIAEQTRMQSRMERDARRAAVTQQREMDRFATRTSHRATRFFWPNMPITSIARRFGSDVARGLGVDMNIGSAMGRLVARESAGMGLAQQERIATGKTAGGARYAGMSAKIGEQLRVAPETITEQMRAFTGKTGEFGMLEKFIPKLSSMSLAAGADMEEMGNAAGFVYNQLKNLPDAGNMTLEVMRGIVGQTAVGAVEMKDYATQMGRVAAHAASFTGSRSENIRKLSALTQLSMQSGGATSAADAARSLVSFVNTFKKTKRIDEFTAQGVRLFEDQTERPGKRGKTVVGGTILRDPFEIIKDSIAKTKGDIPKLSAMYADTLGQKPIKALANAFIGAGGLKDEVAGFKALDAELKKYMGATMDAATEQKNVADYQKTTAAKVQDFQNQIDKVAGSLAERLLPALERATPNIIALADRLGKIAAWAVEHPKTALAGMAGFAAARAGLESAFRAMIEARILGAAGVWNASRGGAPVPAPPGARPTGPRTLPLGGGMILPLLLAGTGLWLAKDQMNKLAKDVGSKRRISEVLPKNADELLEMFIPGVGAFKMGGRLAKFGHGLGGDVSKEMKGLPRKYTRGWVEGMPVEGAQDAAAREEQRKRVIDTGIENYKKKGAVNWEDLPAANQAAAQSDAVRAGTQPVVNAINELGGKTLTVHIDNLPEVPGENGRVSFFD